MLIVELWEGQEVTCNHRCDVREGPCSLLAGPNTGFEGASVLGRPQEEEDGEGEAEAGEEEEGEDEENGKAEEEEEEEGEQGDGMEVGDGPKSTASLMLEMALGGEIVEAMVQANTFTGENIYTSTNLLGLGLCPVWVGLCGQTYLMFTQTHSGKHRSCFLQQSGGPVCNERESRRR